MAIIDTTKSNANSYLHGQGFDAHANGQLVTTSFSFTSGQTRNFTKNFPVDVLDSSSNVLIRVSGTGNTDVDGKWFLFNNRFFFRDFTTGQGFDFLAIMNRSATGQLLTVQLYNATVASTQTPPALTIDIKAIFFSPPW